MRKKLTNLSIKSFKKLIFVTRKTIYKFNINIEYIGVAIGVLN